MVAFAVLVGVGVLHFFVGIPGDEVKCFEDGATVVFAAAEVIDFAASGRLDKGPHETGDVEGVDIVADLFAFVTEDGVCAAFHVAFDQVAQEAVEFNAAVFGKIDADF